MTSSPRPEGWSLVAPVAGDASSRRYSRMAKGRHTAILMECDNTTPGHKISDFVRIARFLSSLGLKAPEIYEAGEGWLLVEDFGDMSFKKAMESGQSPAELYDIAAQVIGIVSHETEIPKLPNYYESHVHANHRYVVDWYMPAARKRENEAGLAEEYLAVWKEIEKKLPPAPKGFLHMDFHAENLMWLPDESGIHRCGILDFQGAMRGPQPYDLGNLLEDARIDVPPEIRTKILQGFDKDYLASYRVLTTQFHCRVIGQFIKMAKENKTQYLQHIPRLQNYLREALQNPLLHPLAQWFEKQGIEFTEKAS